MTAREWVATLLGRLRWASTDSATIGFAGRDRAVMARTFAYLFGAGATLILLTLPLLQSGDRFLPGVIAPPVLAYGAVLLLLIGFDRLPMWLFRALPTVGALLVSVVAYSGGEALGAYAMLYFWVSFSAFFFFGLGAIVDLFFLAIGYAVVLSLRSSASNEELFWVMALGALIVAGGLIVFLRDQLERVAGAMLKDIGRRKRAEARLKKSETQLAEAQRVARLGSWEWDVTGNVVSWSEEMHRIYGTDPERFQASLEAFLERVHPDDRELVEASVTKAMQEGAAFEYYERIIHASGEERILRSKGRVVRDEAGNPVRMFGTCQDVTEQRRAEQALQESEERLRLVLQTAHEAFISIDADGRIIAWNPAAESIFGFAREDVLGELLADKILPERYRGAHERGLERFIRTGEGTVLHKRLELEALHSSGRELPIEMTITPLQLGDRYVFNAFLRDISDRRRSEAFLDAQHAVTEVLAESSTLEEAMPRVLETIAASMGWKVGGFWVVDEQAETLVCKAMWRTSSFEGEAFEALSKELSMAAGVGVPGQVWATRKPVWLEDVTAEANFPRGPAAVEDGLRGAVGLPLVSEGDFLGAIEFFSEEIKAPEEDVVEMMQTISGHIGQFLKRKQAERESDRVKDEFFAAVSHELRTPLTSIIGYTDLLLDGAAGELNPQQQNFLEVTARNARRQLRLVGDLLFVSQVETNTFAIEFGDVDFGKLIGEAVEAAGPAALEKQIELSFECDDVPACQGDRDRLAQLIDNLVSNALKFTPSGGRATLRLSRKDRDLVVEVANTGSHIMAGDQARLFDRFFRASNAIEGAVPGVGLGLTISKAIVVAHGGTIQVRSGEGEGTAFRVVLPLEGPRSVSTFDARSRELAA